MSSPVKIQVMLDKVTTLIMTQTVLIPAGKELESDPYLRKTLVQLPQEKWALSKSDINSTKHALEYIGVVDCFEGVIRYNKMSNNAIITPKKFHDIMKVTGESQAHKVLFFDNDIENIKSAKEVGIITCHLVQGSTGVPFPNTVDFQLDSLYHIANEMKDLRGHKKTSSGNIDTLASLAVKNDIVNTKSKLASNSTNLDKRNILPTNLFLDQELPKKNNPPLPKPSLLSRLSPSPTPVDFNEPAPNLPPPDKKTPVENIKLKQMDIPLVSASSGSLFGNSQHNLMNTTTMDASSQLPSVSASVEQVTTKKKKKKRKKKVKNAEQIDGDDGSEKKRAKQLPPLQVSPRSNGLAQSNVLAAGDRNGNYSDMLKDLNLDEPSATKKKLSPIAFKGGFEDNVNVILPPKKLIY